MVDAQYNISRCLGPPSHPQPYLLSGISDMLSFDVPTDHLPLPFWDPIATKMWVITSTGVLWGITKIIHLKGLPKWLQW